MSENNVNGIIGASVTTTGIIGATVAIGQYIINDYVITIAEAEGDYGYTMTITRGTDTQTVTLYGLTPEQYDAMLGYLEQAQAAAQSAGESETAAREFERVAGISASSASSAKNAAQSAASNARSAASDAASAKNDAVTAKNAAEAAANRAETAAGQITGMTAEAETLEPGSPATASFLDGVLSLGIPAGANGADGNGIVSIIKTGTSGTVDTYTITYTNGTTSTFTVTNGTDGAVVSVAGKTGAVTLNAGDVAFDDQQAYNDGTVGAGLTNLKSALYAISGNTIIDFILHGYISLPSTGIEVGNPTSNTNYRYAVVPCSEGDVFTIDVKSESSAVRTYGFVDNDGNRLAYGSTNSTVKLELKAPENAKYLVLNDVISNRISYCGRLASLDIDALQQQDITNNVMLDALNKGKRFLNIFADYPLQANYSLNPNTGTVGSTSNSSYYATAHNYTSITKYTYIFVVCDPTITQQFWYAFFDEDNTLIGSTFNVNPAEANYIITIPTNAKSMNFGGKVYDLYRTEEAAQKTTVYGNESYFDNEELNQKINDAINTLKTTTGVNKLRVIPNSNDINLDVKTGITNLYLGYNAGGYNGEDGTGTHYDDAKYNVAVGFEAFKSNESGDHSVAIGYECLRSNSSGDFNTAVGEDAMYGNTTGSNNIAIGDHVLQNNNGSNNVVIGPRAMRYATAGSNNIVIGKEAGQSMSIGSHNIVIGNGTDTSSGNASNEIIIGDANHSTVVIAGKTISFNQDGTVTWS